MKFPKLKNAMLCRILTYVTVLGAFVVPAVAVISIKAIPVLAKGLFAFAMGACLLAYMFRNFTVLLSLDVILAGIHCYNTARKQFDISGRRSIRSIEKRVARFGKKCEAAPISPQPDVLRYRFHFPVTVYSKGIEKVVAVYHTDFLDKECYRAIFRSAQTNSKSLIGKKKAILLDKNQKSSPLNRVTVVFIFAARVESQFAATLYDTLCKQDGDGYEEAFLPCIIDVQNYICVFNSMRLPYCGYGYPAKNRGIRLIRKCVYGGRLPLAGNPHFAEASGEFEKDMEQSLWQLWRTIKKELILNKRENKKRFEAMSHGQIVFDEDFLYIKWEKRGAMLALELDEKGKIARLDPICSWEYPKANRIAKRDVAGMKQMITKHFDQLGFSCEFLELEE